MLRKNEPKYDGSRHDDVPSHHTARLRLVLGDLHREVVACREAGEQGEDGEVVQAGRSFVIALVLRREKSAAMFFDDFSQLARDLSEPLVRLIILLVLLVKCLLLRLLLSVHRMHLLLLLLVLVRYLKLLMLLRQLEVMVLLHAGWWLVSGLRRQMCVRDA